MACGGHADKPVAQMRRFAGMLGWNGLELFRLVAPADAGLPAGAVLTFYQTTDEKFFLQINENPMGQGITHQATVCASRYGIRDVGWHRFQMSDDERLLRDEVKRLEPWLARKHFKNPAWRRQFKKQHPELLIPSRKSRPPGK